MPADLQKARELFLHAVGKLPAEQWDDYVTQACGGDAELEQQVKHFLQVHREAGSFLEQPAARLAATGAIAAFSEAPGTMIGPYKLLQKIGEGGMGTVYMAEQMEPVQRKVALKVIKAGLDSRQVIARFEAERQALALMDHPNIARVIDAGEIGGRGQGSGVSEDSSPSSLTPDPCPLTPRPFFVMELVKGVPITKYCDEHHLTVRERLALFVPVCQAVQHAHQKGIIHRDLKPTNVMVCLYDGKAVPKVIDFGVAKAAGPKLTEKTLFTEFGQVLGTLEYMSPEQAEINQLDVDTRSDIYSLGVLLYELLTGTTPLERKRFKAVAMLEVLRLIREEEPPRPSTRLSTTEELPSIAANRSLEPKKLSGLVRGELDWIVMKCLEKDRDRRYETANSLAVDLEHYLADEPVQAGPPSARYRLRKFARRHRGALLIAVVLMLMLAALIGSIGWMIGDRTAREAEITRQVEDSLNVARALMAANQPGLARQKLAGAKVLLGKDREAFAGLAAEVEAFEADLDRWRRFLDLIDQAHEAEISDFPEWSGPVLTLAPNDGSLAAATFIAERRPARAVTFILKALACYEVLEREDWCTPLENSVVGKKQVEEVRRTAYEELLWLAIDVIPRREDHRSGKQLSGESASRRALAYLGSAEKAHPPTQGFYHLRANCQKAVGQDEAARADQELAQNTSPTMAFDYYQRGEAAYAARNKAEAIKAYEAGLRLEPTHFWSMVRLGGCLCDLGQGREDYTAAIMVFTGCIMKRPEYAHAYRCRGHANTKLGQWDKAIDDYSKAIELAPKYVTAWYDRGCCYRELRQWDKAIAGFSKAIELDPKYASAWTNRGVSYCGMGQESKAIPDFSKAIDVNPKDAGAWTNRGAAYLSLRQQDKAVADFSQAIDLAPNYASPWYHRGLAYHEMRQFDKAISDYSRAIELDPKERKAWIKRDEVFLTLGQADKSVAAYSTLVGLVPKDPQAWTNLALAYGNLGQWDKALAAYSKAIDVDPKDALAWNNRGYIYRNLGQLDKAVTDYSKAIELDPRRVGAWNNRGKAYGILGQWDKAIADCSRATELDPKLPKAWYNRATIYGKLGQWNKALHDFSTLIELAPNDPQAWTNRGVAFGNLGQWNKAIADDSKAIELNPKYAAAWYNRGNAYAMLGQWDKAIDDFSKAIELNPKYAAAWYNRGNAYAMLGQWDKAIADLSLAIELNPKSAPAWINRGVAYGMLGQSKKVIADLSKAIELDPKSAEAWTHRGAAYGTLGQWDKAIPDHSKAIELNPKVASAWMNRGVAYGNLRQLDKAIVDFSKAIELDPKYAPAWTNRGVAYVNLGQLDKAIADHSKAIDLDAKAAEAWYNRGCAYGKLGEWDKALADHSKAIELNPKLATAWIDRGIVYGKLGQWDKALADRFKVIALEPTNAARHSELAWLLATHADSKVRDPGQAVELAKKAIALAPKVGAYWNTLGTAQYRAGEWQQASEALKKSMELGNGGTAWDCFFLAMAHWQLGHKEEARHVYDRAVTWMNANQRDNDELRRFRAEAAKLLDVKD